MGRADRADPPTTLAPTVQERNKPGFTQAELFAPTNSTNAAFALLIHCTLKDVLVELMAGEETSGKLGLMSFHWARARLEGDSTEDWMRENSVTVVPLLRKISARYRLKATKLEKSVTLGLARLANAPGLLVYQAGVTPSDASTDARRYSLSKVATKEGVVVVVVGMLPLAFAMPRNVLAPQLLELFVASTSPAAGSPGPVTFTATTLAETHVREGISNFVGLKKVRMPDVYTLGESRPVVNGENVDVSVTE